MLFRSLLAVLGLAGTIDRSASDADLEALRTVAIARELARGYHLCPPAADGMTSLLTLVIESTADDLPVVVSCHRLAQRKYVPRTADQFSSR